MTSAHFRGFPPGALDFLRDLQKNNNRPWFQAHKPVFVEQVRQPMVELVTAIGGALQGIAPGMVTEPKRVIYRIYRDTRFSADKTPYKTHTAANFYTRGLPKHGCASLYFHLSPDELLVAGGAYMPGPTEIRSIRNHIAGNWKELESILRESRLRKHFGRLQGDGLIRPPKGFAPDHPAIELLKKKQWYVYASDNPGLATSPKLLPRLITLFSALLPLIRFLNAPLLGGKRVARS